jgi:hypothetical protein
MVASSTIPGDAEVATWYLQGPTVGAHNLTFNFQSSLDLSHLIEIAASYTGVSNSTIPDASNTNAGSGVSSFISTLSTVTDRSWVTLCALNDQNFFTAGSGSTKRDEFGALALFDSNGPISPSGNYSMSATYPTTGQYANVMSTITPR